MNPLVFLLALAVAGAPPAPAPAVRAAPPRAGLSWEMADTLDRKLKAIETRRTQSAKKRETVLVSEGEVNSYLNLTYASQLPKGVSHPDVRLQGGRIVVKGYVDLDEVRGKVPEPTSMWNPMSLLSGKVPVEITGRLSGRDGFGTVQVETVYLSSIRVPTTVLEEMVARSTKSAKMPEGFDIHSPFRLPYTLSGVRVEPGRAALEI
jgi:hypothetical protein